jgi:hypothetical protein
MPQPTTFQLWYGREEPPLEPISLHAGPLTAQLLGRDLRNVRFGGLEVAQRIYVAVRDRNWGTVPGELADLDVVQGDDHFAVRFTVRHCQHDIDFTWRGEILGAAGGTISYAMDATAGADMTYKLIGLNIHHGMREYVGRPYQGMTPRGPISGRFPVEVGPQLVADETEVPIFPDVSSLTAQLTDDLSVRFDFVGDTFEFEDQRNWTDASFKSQSYPPRRGGFLSSRVGDRVFQKVTLTVSGEASSAAAQPVGAMPASPGGPQGHEREASITIGAPTGTKLPPIGFGMAGHGGELSPREVELLRALHPAHLRADLRLIGGGYGAELERALAACRAVGCGIELAVFVSDDAANEMLALGERLRDCDVPIRRILIFHEAEQATDARWVTLAREALAPAAPGALIAGGTDANFCELNRNRPRYTPGDGVSYAITPQIHAFDERSLTENIAAQAETVATARHFSDDAPIVVSPVTLKPRFNAVATTEEPAPAPGELPPPVDPRQMSLFAAGWTVGSVGSLARAGAASLTYYETTGWRGLMETETGSPVPAAFPSRPGDVFPLYHVFADLAEWQDGEIISTSSDDPLAVEALAIRTEDRSHLLIANHTPHGQRVRISPLADGEVSMRRLNAENAPRAMADPQDFRASAESAPIDGGSLQLTLAPFEVVRIDTGG